MKQIFLKAAIPFALSIAAASAVYANSAVTDIANINAAVTAETAETPIEADSKVHYIQFSGKIDSILNEKNIMQISVIDENNETIVFNIHEDTLLYSLNSTEKIPFSNIEKGRTVSVFYNVMTPQLLSFPPQIGPEVVIVHDNETPRFVKVDYFDENSLSSDGLLKLNLSEEILIFNSSNEVVPFEETLEKNLLVFYEITTRSLPPQTPPVKVIILDSDVLELTSPEIIEEENDKPQNIFDLLDEEDIIERDGIRYYALYKVAQIKGLNLSWSEETATVTISSPKNSSSFTFINNSQEYGFNRNLKNFANAPFIMNDRTYVDEAFISEIENELTGVINF